MAVDLESTLENVVFSAFSGAFLIGIRRPSPRPNFPADVCCAVGGTGFACVPEIVGTLGTRNCPGFFEGSLSLPLFEFEKFVMVFPCLRLLIKCITQISNRVPRGTISLY